MHQHPPVPGLVGVGPPLRDPPDLGVHRGQCRLPGALAPPQRVQVGQRPGAGGAQRHPAPTRAPQLAADHEQPRVEDGGGVGALRVLEERAVDRSRPVVEGQEDDASPRPDRRRLGRDLDPGDQQLGAAAPAQQVAAAGGAEVVEEVGVGGDGVLADVEAQDLQLGPHPLVGGHLGQPGDHLARPRLVAQLEGQLDRVGLPDRTGRLRLGRRPHGRVGAGARALRPARSAPVAPSSRPAAPPGHGRGTCGRASGCAGRARRPGAAGRGASAGPAVGPRAPRSDAVEVVEGPGQHQPLQHRSGDPGPGVEVADET